MTNVDLSKLVAVDKLGGDDWQESEELKELAELAEDFISEFGWAGNVLQAYAGPAIPSLLGVFLFRLDPAASDVDEWLWVIVGDLPPAYLVTDEAPDAVKALELYVEAMGEWVSAVRQGSPVDELIPVNVPATVENAELLATRLSFIRDRAIPEFRKDS